MTKRSVTATNNTHNKSGGANIQKGGNVGLSLVVVIGSNLVII